MVKIIEAPCYDEISMAAVDRLVHGHKPKKDGMELIMDNEIGPDVRYVLSRNDIKLVKQYLMGPITPAEFRELRHKLTELRGQKVKPEEVVDLRHSDKKIELYDIRSSGDSKKDDTTSEKPDPAISVFV